MIVCICNGISDRTIRAAVRCGARDLGDVARACEAGGDCGSCHDQIRGIIGDADRATEGRSSSEHHTHGAVSESFTSV